MKLKKVILFMIIFTGCLMIYNSRVYANINEIGEPESITNEYSENYEGDLGKFEKSTDNLDDEVSAFGYDSLDSVDVSVSSAYTVNEDGFLEVSYAGTRNYGYAKNVFDLVNSERAKQGLSALKLDKDLSEAAMHRAAELYLNFSHTRPNGKSCFSVMNSNHYFMGENIAAGQWSPEVVMNTWMNSSGHKGNILGSNFKSMGVGCFYKDGVYFWVQLFGTDYNEGAKLSGTESGTAVVEVALNKFKVNANNSTNAEVEITKEATLKCTVEYSGQTFDLANTNITYESSDTSIATVTNGKLKALKLGTVTITAKAGSNTAKCTVKVVPKVFSVYYRTHVQNVGWQGYVKNGATAGTSGQSLRLEGINIYLDNLPVSGGIEYCTHVQNIGWQGYVKNGAMSGTSGQSLRLEAIKIRLTGEVANQYDIYYRVHCQNFGWMGWAKNGESAGSAGYAYRLEAIQIKLVKKGGGAPGSTANKFKQNIQYQTHVENIGWQGYVSSGEMSGTSGQSLRLEGIRITLGSCDISGNVEYCTHVQNIGWQGYVKNGEMSGTSGQSLRLEAIKIRLTGNLANTYDIYYRVHCQNFGWMGWAKNGESAGSAGYSYRLEGIQIVLVDKGGAAPGSTVNAFIQR